MELVTGIGDLLGKPHRKFLEKDILPGYLKSRRWYASKDQDIIAVHLVEGDVVEFGNETILFAEVEVALPAKTERYQLPLGLKKTNPADVSSRADLSIADVTIGPDTFIVIDAFELDVLAIGLSEAMKSNVALETSRAEIRCSSLAGFSDAFPTHGLSIKRLSAEQSNSSLVFGASMIMKLIRRITHGVNPEVEMIKYLTEKNFSHTPPMLGEVQHVDRNGSSYTMYVAQKFVANEGDGWGNTLDFLNSNAPDLSAYRAFAGAIGRRLAQLHEVLSRHTDEAAFQPRECTPDDAKAWAAAAERQLNSAFEVLANSKNLSSELLADRDAVLARRKETIFSVIELARSGIGSLMTRIHGDFHLGQVLVSDGDAFIIDFEGEPSKPLEIRRAKASPMRDVAGLLRSLDYAAAASETGSDHFVHEASAVFLNAYQEVLDNASRRWVQDGDQKAALLDLFLLEKCAYEICYEAANRPAWVAIPLRGFVNIIARVLNAPEIANA